MNKQIMYRNKLFDVKWLESRCEMEADGDRENFNAYFSSLLWRYFIGDFVLEVRPRKNTDEDLLMLMSMCAPTQIVAYHEWKYERDACQFFDDGHIAPVNKTSGLYDTEYPNPAYVGFFEAPIADERSWNPEQTTWEDDFVSFPRFDYLLLPIPINCMVREPTVEEKLYLSHYQNLPEDDQQKMLYPLQHTQRSSEEKALYAEHRKQFQAMLDNAVKKLAKESIESLQKAAGIENEVPVTIDLLRQELAPLADLARKIDHVAPQVATDRRKAQLAWIQKVEGCSEIERKAALLRTGGMTLPEIAKRLPHKNGKPMTRQGVRQALLRFAKKAGQHGLFSKGTYRQNIRIESEANEPDEDGTEPASS